jgi:signal peptidase I
VKTFLGILAVVTLVIGLKLMFPFYRVYGTSDEPTVHNGQYALAVRYWLREPERGDMITFTQSFNGTQLTLIKRIIGLPGDVIQIQGATVIEDGVQLQEPYVAHPGNPNGNQHLEYVVPNDEFFALGDNRAVSDDSRDFGFISRSAIIARVVFLLGKGNTGLVPNVSYVFAGIHSGGIWQISLSGSQASSDTTLFLTSTSTFLFWIARRKRQAKAFCYRHRTMPVM